jgi:hypothetical protein
VHPVGVRQHVEAHQSKDNQHNHGAHDPHDAHFGFLSVLFILVWHPFPPELCPRPFVLTLDVAQRNVGEILFVSAYVSLTAYPQSALKSLSSTIDKQAASLFESPSALEAVNRFAPRMLLLNPISTERSLYSS